MYYPIMIQMYEKDVMVFGGGRIAYRKCRSILECGGKVTVVSKSFLDEFHLLDKKYYGFLALKEDEYNEKYLEDCDLIIAATNNKETNEVIYQNCRSRNLLCSVVDNGSISDYIFPSVVRRGDLIISVSTSGKSPSLSVKIKEEIEQLYGDDFEEYVNLLGVIREKVLAQNISEKEKKKILNGLINKSMEELYKFKVKN